MKTILLVLLLATTARAELWSGSFANRKIVCQVINQLTSDPHVQDAGTVLVGTCTKIVGHKRALEIYPPIPPHAALSRLCRRFRPATRKHTAYERLRGPCCHVTVDMMHFVPITSEEDTADSFSATVTCRHRVIGELVLSDHAFAL